MEALPSISNQSQLAHIAQMADEAIRLSTFGHYHDSF
jgi:hypothetical protein